VGLLHEFLSDFCRSKAGMLGLVPTEVKAVEGIGSKDGIMAVNRDPGAYSIARSRYLSPTLGRLHRSRE